MRAAVTGTCLILCLGGACKPKPAQEPAPRADASRDAGALVADTSGPVIVKEEGPMPTADTVVASAGEHEITVGEFEHSARVSLLFGPEGLTEMPPERLAIPHIHLTMTRALLGRELMMAEATRRGIAPTDAELHAWLEENDKLDRLATVLDDEAKLAAALEPYGLTRADLLEVARVSVTTDAFTDALVEAVTDEEVWQTYEQQRSTRTLAVVTMSNVPTSEEIDAFVRDEPQAIDEYYRENVNEFRIPRRARINIVRPAPGTKVDDATLAKAAADLARGVQPVTVAKTHGLEYELDVEVVRAENPKAFAAKPGETGWEADGPRGAYAWRLQGFESSRLPEMTRPLRRQIAAKILRVDSLTPHAEKRLDELARTLEKLPKDELAAAFVSKEDVEFEVVTATDHPRGLLPGFGLAEEVVEAAFRTGVGEVSEPLLSRERGFVFKVLDRTVATREEFDANLAANRKAYQDAFRPRALQLWVEGALQEKQATVDTKPLRVKYGVLQKKK